METLGSAADVNPDCWGVALLREPGGELVLLMVPPNSEGGCNVVVPGAPGSPDWPEAVMVTVPRAVSDPGSDGTPLEREGSPVAAPVLELPLVGG